MPTSTRQEGLSTSERFLRRWSALHGVGVLLATGIALATRSLPVLLAGAVSIAILAVMWRRLEARDGTSKIAFGVGAANAITLGRVALLGIGAVVAERSLVALGVLAFAAFVLDAVDGWVARRRGEASTFGARLDVEADAFAMIVLATALFVTRTAPFWVLAVGLVRFVYVVFRAACGVEKTVERRSRLGRWIFFTAMTSLIAGCLPLAPQPRTIFLEIGTGAVLVSFVTDFRLLARETWHVRAVILLAVVLDLLLFVPAVVFGDVITMSPVRDLLHVSAELAALVALAILVARTRAAPIVRWAGAVLYTFFVLFLFYHLGYLSFFRRPPAISSDVRLLVHLFHFVKGQPAWAILAIAAIAALGLLALSVAAFFRQLEGAVRAARPRFTFVVPALLLVPVGGSLAWSGFDRDAPIVQPLSKHVRTNVRFSRIRRDMERALAAAPPDLRYEVFLRPVLVKKPNVHLLMIESYGTILATSDMRDAYRDALAELESRLVGRGYGSATAWSTSSTWGGSSWFAISTVQTGVRIDNQDTYEVLEAASAQLPSLTSFFRAQGYTTISVMPGNMPRAGLKGYDLFGRDIVLEQPQLEYTGYRFGWGSVAPDQWALSFYRERVLNPGPKPRFFFFMSTTTHWPWINTPPYVEDWHTLELNRGEMRTIKRAPRPGFENIRTELHRQYYSTVDYTLQILGDYITKEDDDDALFVIMGDHQPCIDDYTKETWVHVVTRDAALLDRFRTRGFAEHLFAESSSVVHLQHAGIFSLLATVLAEHAGDGTKLPYYPTGLPTSALKR
jgi:phosphatidylglycerophosphate synthase